MRVSLTRAMVTSPRARAGATRRSHSASPRMRSGRPRSSTTTTRKEKADLPRRSAPCVLAREGGSGAAVSIRELLVGLDDLLHELVAHNIPIVEVNERDALDVADDLHRLDQAGGATDRQVDLCDVPGNHGFRTEAQPGEEHLHLLGRGV